VITLLGETFSVTPQNLFSIAFETVLSLHPENADVTLRPHPGLLSQIPSLYEETALTTVIKVEEAQRDTPHHQGKVVGVVSIRPLKDEETQLTLDTIQEGDHIPNEQEDAVLICFIRIRIIPKNGFDRAQFFRDWANQILIRVKPTPATRAQASRADDGQKEQTKSENGFKHQHSTMQRSVKVVAIVLPFLGVLIMLVANVASTTLPKEWTPYLWLSWPLLGVLVSIDVILVWQVRKTGTPNT
jgi:hypothetical protein